MRADDPLRQCRRGSSEPENDDEGLVDGPHLLRLQPAHSTTEPLNVDGADLLDQHAGEITGDVDLRPEQRRLGASRGWSDDDDRAGQHHVGLHNDAVPLVPRPLGILKRQTSPRCTHRLHQRRDGEHLVAVVVIDLECGDLSSQLSPSRPASAKDSKQLAPVQPHRGRSGSRPMGAGVSEPVSRLG